MNLGLHSNKGSPMFFLASVSLVLWQRPTKLCQLYILHEWLPCKAIRPYLQNVISLLPLLGPWRKKGSQDDLLMSCCRFLLMTMGLLFYKLFCVLNTSVFYPLCGYYLNLFYPYMIFQSRFTKNKNVYCKYDKSGKAFHTG